MGSLFAGAKIEHARRAGFPNCRGIELSTEGLTNNRIALYLVSVALQRRISFNHMTGVLLMKRLLLILLMMSVVILPACDWWWDDDDNNRSTFAPSDEYSIVTTTDADGLAVLDTTSFSDEVQLAVIDMGTGQTIEGMSVAYHLLNGIARIAVTDPNGEYMTSYAVFDFTDANGVVSKTSISSGILGFLVGNAYGIYIKPEFREFKIAIGTWLKGTFVDPFENLANAIIDHQIFLDQFEPTGYIDTTIGAFRDDMVNSVEAFFGAASIPVGFLQLNPSGGAVSFVSDIIVNIAADAASDDVATIIIDHFSRYRGIQNLTSDQEIRVHRHFEEILPIAIHGETIKKTRYYLELLNVDSDVVEINQSLSATEVFYASTGPSIDDAVNDLESTRVLVNTSVLDTPVFADDPTPAPVPNPLPGIGDTLNLVGTNWQCTDRFFVCPSLTTSFTVSFNPSNILLDGTVLADDGVSGGCAIFDLPPSTEYGLPFLTPGPEIIIGQDYFMQWGVLTATSATHFQGDHGQGLLDECTLIE